jgi:hypothetical protein
MNGIVGKEFNHNLALSFKEKGKKINLIPSGVTL